MAGEDERIHFELGVVHDGFERPGHVLVGGEDREVLEAHGLRALDRHGDKRRRRLEAHTHENDLTIGAVLGKIERVERGVHDLDRTAGGLLFQQARGRTGHARHIAERGDRHVLDA